MVQVGSPYGYHNGVEENEGEKVAEASWTSIIKDAAKDFMSSIADSSKQLATAAEKLAADSLRVLEDATSKVQTSAAVSSEMATAAKEAAAEAQRHADGVRDSISSAAEQAKEDASLAVQAALLQVEETATRAKEELQLHADEAFARFQQYSETGEQSHTQVQQALDATERLQSELQQRIDAAIEQLERTASATESAVATAQAAADSAKTAADEAKEQVFLLEQKPASQPTALSDGAKEVLERLETDYQLLSQLVQELASRIATLSMAAPVHEAAPMAADEPEAEPMAPMAETPSAPYDSWGDVQPTAAEPSQEEPAALEGEEKTPEPAAYNPWEGYSSFESKPAETSEPIDEPMADPWAIPAATPVMSRESPMLTGRVAVKLSPVPDFDRLLGLDSALGRMNGVHNVTLADYAQEEVTFRLELEASISSEEFARKLSESAGLSTSVVSAEPDSLTLKLN